MIKKICPICDQVMKENHYCRSCRRWIRHPNEINAHYYLNERHPQREENCEYHRPPQNSQNMGKNLSRGNDFNGKPKPTQIYSQKQTGSLPSILIVIFVALFLMILLSVVLPFFLYFI